MKHVVHLLIVLKAQCPPKRRPQHLRTCSVPMIFNLVGKDLLEHWKKSSHTDPRSITLSISPVLYLQDSFPHYPEHQAHGQKFTWSPGPCIKLFHRLVIWETFNLF